MAARTRVYIDASADQLEREIKKAERALERLGREATESGRDASRGFGQGTAAASRYARAAGAATAATARVGNAARTAAPYLGAGLALGLAKSVSEFREAEKAASQTEAALKSNGTAANVTAEEIAKLSQTISAKAGIDDEAIQSSSNLLLTFQAIRNEAGKGNDVFNQATQLTADLSVAWDQDLSTSAKQLGKALNDPVLGMTALSKVGVQFTEQQKEQIAALIESGETLKAQKVILKEITSQVGGSAKAQADSFDKLKVNAENFAEAIGKEVTPALSDMADGLSDILGNKKLTGAERMDKLGDFFEEWVGKGIDALEDAGPEIAETGGKLGLKAIEGFGNAFMESSILGKLFLGGAALRLFGGPGVFRALGGTMGKKTGLSMGRAIGPAMLLALPLLLPEALELGKRIGREIRGPIEDALDFAEDGLTGGMTDTAPGFESPMKAAKTSLAEGNTGEEISAFLKEVFGTSDKRIYEILLKVNGLKTTKDLHTIDAGVEKSRKGWDRYGEGVAKNTEKGSRAADRHAGQAKNDLNVIVGGLDEGKNATDAYASGVGRNFDRVDKKSAQMAARTSASVGSMAVAVATGLANIADNTNSALEALGVKKIAFSVTSIAKDVGNVIGKQRGGAIPGFQTGDIVPALLEPGEFVMNRNAVEAFGPQLFAMNSAVPRFQKGGVARLATGGVAQPPGDPGTEVVQSGYEVPVGKFLQNYGMDLTQGYNPGGPSVSPGHLQLGVPPSLDVVPLDGNWDGAFADGLKWALAQGMQVGYDGQYGTQAWSGHGEGNHAHIDWSGASIGKIGGAAVKNAVVEKIKRQMLKGPNSPLKSFGQSALDKAHKGANAYISRQAPKSTAGSESMGATGPGAKIKNLPSALQQYNRTYAEHNSASSDWGGYVMPRNAIAAVAEWVGTPGDTMEYITRGESAGRPGATGIDPGGTKGLGLWMITTGYNDALIAKHGGPSQMLNPILNAFAMKSIYDGQGLGAWYADHPSDPNDHYEGNLLKRQRGGPVGKVTPKGLSRATKPDGKIQLPSKGGPPLGITGVPGFIPDNVNLGVVAPPQLNYEQQLVALSIALTTAEGTASTDDDQAIVEQQQALIQGRRDAVASQLSNLALTKQQREQAKAAAIKSVKALEAKLIKSGGGLNAKEKRQLDAARTAAAQSIGQGMLETERGELLDELSGLTSELSAAQEAINALAEEQMADLIATMQSLAEAQAETNRILSSESSIQRSETVRALADILSGEIGGRTSLAGMTAGYGSVVSA